MDKKKNREVSENSGTSDNMDAAAAAVTADAADVDAAETAAAAADAADAAAAETAATSTKESNESQLSTNQTEPSFVDSESWRRALWQMRYMGRIASSVIDKQNSGKFPHQVGLDGKLDDQSDSVAISDTDEVSNENYTGQDIRYIPTVEGVLKSGAQHVAGSALSSIFEEHNEHIAAAFQSMLAAIPNMTDTPNDGYEDQIGKIPRVTEDYVDMEKGTVTYHTVKDLRAIALGHVTADLMDLAASKLRGRVKEHYDSLEKHVGSKLDKRPWIKARQELNYRLYSLYDFTDVWDDDDIWGYDEDDDDEDYDDDYGDLGDLEVMLNFYKTDQNYDDEDDEDDDEDEDDEDYDGYDEDYEDDDENDGTFSAGIENEEQPALADSIRWDKTWMEILKAANLAEETYNQYSKSSLNDEQLDQALETIITDKAVSLIKRSIINFNKVYGQTFVQNFKENLVTMHQMSTETPPHSKNLRTINIGPTTKHTNNDDDIINNLEMQLQSSEILQPKQIVNNELGALWLSIVISDIFAHIDYIIDGCIDTHLESVDNFINEA